MREACSDVFARRVSLGGIGAATRSRKHAEFSCGRIKNDNFSGVSVFSGTLMYRGDSGTQLENLC